MNITILRDRALNHVLATAMAAAFLLGIGGVSAVARAGEQRHVDETARTPAAVMDVDQHWLEAEVGGDTAWLDAMLLPDYRSIGSDGKVSGKSAILESAKKNRGSNTMRKQVDAWLATHPSRQSVVLHGDVAILSFSDPKTGRIRSSDIFIYKDGGWHALYSQHSKTE